MSDIQAAIQKAREIHARVDEMGALPGDPRVVEHNVFAKLLAVVEALHNSNVDHNDWCAVNNWGSDKPLACDCGYAEVQDSLAAFAAEVEKYGR